MYRVIIIAAALVVAWYLWNWLKSGYQKHGRPFAVKATLVIAAGVLLLLASIGRVHWLGAALASVLAGLRFALPLLLRSLPFLHQFQKARAEQQTGDNSGASAKQRENSGNIDEHEAREILGVTENASRQEIIEAHRRLIQKLHPDRGGNDYLASRINRAKDILLKQFD
ncbi:MAG: DnaJ domain-containing protein [Gammaproteobacteria bacterium]|nr:DnaJ domain-containing protein [Gammaproteobacteria bacterium]MBT8149894.1 DnaJ domain-containing protein [Gammaproteobacteria bacterium]RZV56071.1 MAG: molecular chaperone DnaJ [Pseudomonadales bacterium]